MALGIGRADRATPLYPLNLALCSPACRGDSVGEIRSRTKATKLLSPYFHFTDYRRSIILALKARSFACSSGRHVSQIKIMKYSQFP
jgi:hypothetical protein